MVGAVERLADEIDQLADLIVAEILASVPEYEDEPVAKLLLRPFVRQNADEVMREFRGIATTTAAARNVALTDAIATGLSLETIERTFQIGRDRFRARLLELGDGEDLAEPLARLDEAYETVIAAVRDEYRAVKERRGGD